VGEIADTEVAHGLDTATQDLGRDADGETVHQTVTQQGRDQGSSTLDQHRADTQCTQLEQQRGQISTAFGVGRQA
jgi:hypothetical protein